MTKINIFHDQIEKSMTFQTWKMIFQNSMTFQVFHDPYEPCLELCFSTELQATVSCSALSNQNQVFLFFSYISLVLRHYRKCILIVLYCTCRRHTSVSSCWDMDPEGGTLSMMDCAVACALIFPPLDSPLVRSLEFLSKNDII